MFIFCLYFLWCFNANVEIFFNVANQEIWLVLYIEGLIVVRFTCYVMSKALDFIKFGFDCPSENDKVDCQRIVTNAKAWFSYIANHRRAIAGNS